MFYFDYLLIQVLETCSIFRWSRPADSLCKRRTPDDEDDEDGDDKNGEDDVDDEDDEDDEDNNGEDTP